MLPVITADTVSPGKQEHCKRVNATAQTQRSYCASFAFNPPDAMLTHCCGNISRRTILPHNIKEYRVHRLR